MSASLLRSSRTNDVFDQLPRRSLRDLRALTRRPQGGILAAGIPWYVTLFGRDALIARTSS